MNRALLTAAAEVLETMFFTEVQETPAGVIGEQPGISARLTFRGQPSGAFSLSATEFAARSLAAGFLGHDEEGLEAAQIGEVLCELANMICGSLLSQLESETVFELHHPELADWEPLAEEVPGGEVACGSLDWGEGVIRLSLALRTDPIEAR